jgi:dolichyl-phosphate beta-glucosyltransferase
MTHFDSPQMRSAREMIPSASDATSRALRDRQTPPTGQAYLSIVLPVWNGADRLSRTLYALHQLLTRQRYATELIVVDDCSDRDAVHVIDSFCGDVADKSASLRVRRLRNERNRGKGFSVAHGMLAATGAIRVFTDADLAYPPEEIESIVDALEKGNDIAIACRVLPQSRYIMSPTFFPYLFTRHVMSRAYNAVVRRVLVASVLDTQAGLKGFTSAAAELIFPRLTIHSFGFDVECLYIAQRHRQRLVQVPVTFRYDDEPSTVRVLRDGTRMVTDLARIFLNARRGHYD